MHTFSAFVKTFDANQPRFRRLAPVQFAAVALLCTGLCTPCCPCAASDGSGTQAQLAKLAAEAKNSQERSDFRTAAAAYEQIVRLRPDVAEAWANLGLMYEFLGDYAQANQSFKSALSRKPALYTPNLYLGLNLLRLHDPGAAARYLRTALKVNAGDEQAALGLARAYQALNAYSQANRAFYLATEINAQDPEAWYGLGVSFLSLQDAAVLQLMRLGRTSTYGRALLAEAFVEQNRVDDAISTYKQLLKSPASPPCLSAALGLAHLEQSASDLAHKAFEDEIKTSPSCSSAYLGLARIAISRGDYARALDHVREACQTSLDFVNTNLQRMWAKVDPDRLEQAKTWFRNTSASDGFARALADSIESGQVKFRSGDAFPRDRVGPPANSSMRQREDRARELWSAGHPAQCVAVLKQLKAPSELNRLLLCQCSFYAGDYTGSLAVSDSVLVANPSSLPGLFWKAKSAQLLADDALQKVVAIAPGSPKVHLLMAELRRARQDPHGAEAEYMEAMKATPDDPSAHLGLAHIYLDESQDDQAVQQLQYVFRSDPNDAEGSFCMGKILVRRQQYRDAMPYLRAALKGSSLMLPEVHSLLARCYASQQSYSSAISELKLALPSDPMGIFHYQLYQVYEKLGDHGSALIALRQSQTLRRAEQDAEEVRISAKHADSNP